MAKTSKYYIDRKYVSYDEGQTWVPTLETREGKLFQDDSLDCGFVPPEEYRLKLTYDNGAVYYAPTCITNLYERDSKGFNIPYTEIVSAEFGCDWGARIGTMTFGGCKKLRNVQWEKIVDIGGYAFDNTNISTAVIPSGQTYLGMFAFRGCQSLTSVTFNNELEEIGQSAFYGCTSLSSITMPNTVSAINDSSFAFCTSLKNITIPNDNCIFNGYYHFHACVNLETAVLPKNLTALSPSMFSFCRSLKNIEIPSGVTILNSACFRKCLALTSITIPNSVTRIEASAFAQSNIKSIVIPNPNCTVEYGVFANCEQLSSVTLPSNLAEIGGYAFSACTSLKSITIPQSVTKIKEFAFSKSGLQTISIPSSVTTIERAAFLNCSGLTSVTVLATTPPTLGSEGVFGNTNDCPIYVPSGSVNAYKSATNWSSYSSRIQGI